MDAMAMDTTAMDTTAMDTTGMDTAASDAGTGCTHISMNLRALTLMTTETTHRLRLHHSLFHLRRRYFPE
jgi:hypothetical protein